MPPGRLVHATRLHADEPIFDDVRATYAVHAADLVQQLDQCDRRVGDAINRDGVAVVEPDLNVLRAIGRIFRCVGQHVHVRRRFVGRILERTALVRDVPEVAVARVDLGFGGRHLDAARRRIVDRVLARADIPLTPRRDHLELRRKRSVG